MKWMLMISLLLSSFATPIYGDLAVTTNGAISFSSGVLPQKINLNKSGTVVNRIVSLYHRIRHTAGIQSIIFSGTELNIGNPTANDASIEPAILGVPLNFPNPFRQATGTDLGYRLSKNMDVEILIYDMHTNQVFRNEYKAGTPGGQAGYNKLTLNLNTYNQYQLSAGVYFYYIVHEGKVLGKGKMAVQP